MQDPYDTRSCQILARCVGRSLTSLRSLFSVSSSSSTLTHRREYRRYVLVIFSITFEMYSYFHVLGIALLLCTFIPVPTVVCPSWAYFCMMYCSSLGNFDGHIVIYVD